MSAITNHVEITDCRSGRKVRVKVADGAVHATALKPLLLYDPGYMNTACCTSRISFIDGAKGILWYRGYPIEELVKTADYEEVAFLVVFGELPTAGQLREFKEQLCLHRVLPTPIKDLIRSFSRTAHPMGVLMAAMAALGTCRPESNPAVKGQTIYTHNREVRNREVVRILGVMPTLAASIYRHLDGLDMCDPDVSCGFSESFMRLLDHTPTANPVMTRAMDVLFILHADHELSCSTAAVRHVVSAGADVYTAVAAGVGALYGPRHGGANEAVVKMLEEIEFVGNVPAFLNRVKQRKSRLMGFGHRVYKNYDPRARVVKRICGEIMELLGKDALLDVAMELEKCAITDKYFVSRSLYPNVDFYSGLIYRAMGFDSSYFTVLFAVARTAGWLAHWLELETDPENRIIRPIQIYKGPGLREYMPINTRTQIIEDEVTNAQVTSAERRRLLSKL